MACGACTRSWIARAAGASTPPRASIGNGSAGGNSRIKGRGDSGFTSFAAVMVASKRSRDMMRLAGIVIEQHVRHVLSRFGRHRDAHAPRRMSRRREAHRGTP
jgi:hypothetical protein